MSSPLGPPKLYVPEPPVQQAGFGIYSGANVVNTNDAHARNGSEWQATFCGTAQPFPYSCEEPSTPPPALGGFPLIQAEPFGVSAGRACKLVGTTLQELQTSARGVMTNSEEYAVELAYWTGDPFPDGTQTPHLTGVDPDDVLSDTAVSAARGLGLLEEALGRMSGVVGVIHAPRHSFGVLKGFVSASGGKMRTELGTVVVFGSGYTGSGPGGAPAADGTTWLYATGPVQVVRTQPIDLPNVLEDALDRETNDATVKQVRIISVGHACGLVAVPITLP